MTIDHDDSVTHVESQKNFGLVNALSNKNTMLQELQIQSVGLVELAYCLSERQMAELYWRPARVGNDA